MYNCSLTIICFVKNSKFCIYFSFEDLIKSICFALLHTCGPYFCQPCFLSSKSKLMLLAELIEVSGAVRGTDKAVRRQIEQLEAQLEAQLEGK